jgi:hypothetical protein
VGFHYDHSIKIVQPLHSIHFDAYACENLSSQLLDRILAIHRHKEIILVLIGSNVGFDTNSFVSKNGKTVDHFEISFKLHSDNKIHDYLARTHGPLPLIGPVKTDNLTAHWLYWRIEAQLNL